MSRKKGTLNSSQSKIAEIVQQHVGGMSVRELAEIYGKPFWTIKNMIRRERQKTNLKANGLPPKQRGRKAAVTLQEYKCECKRLKMENELLRDFLHLAGRR